MWTQVTILLKNKIIGLVKFLKHWALPSLTSFHIQKFHHIKVLQREKQQNYGVSTGGAGQVG